MQQMGVSPWQTGETVINERKNMSKKLENIEKLYDNIIGRMNNIKRVLFKDTDKLPSDLAEQVKGVPEFAKESAIRLIDETINTFKELQNAAKKANKVVNTIKEAGTMLNSCDCDKCCKDKGSSDDCNIRVVKIGCDGDISITETTLEKLLND